MLQAKHEGKTSLQTSLDLGITSVEALITPNAITFQNTIAMSWANIEKINSDKNCCYLVSNNVLNAIKGYSVSTGRSFSLMPTQDAPAMIIAGFPMHRIKNITPLSAAKCMVDAIAPMRGEVLDTATGLGYTAIAASKTATRVVTIEYDPIAQEMAHQNPWSRDLFNNPKITQLIGDSAEEIQKFPLQSFSAIIHDPPSISLAGDLYSGAFYQCAYRTLMEHGRMFHYIGDPESSFGARVTQGVLKRLKEAGFKKVDRIPKAFGVVAYK
jgi:predicted methyltransferase